MPDSWLPRIVSTLTAVILTACSSTKVAPVQTAAYPTQNWSRFGHQEHVSEKCAARVMVLAGQLTNSSITSVSVFGGRRIALAAAGELELQFSAPDCGGDIGMFRYYWEDTTKPLTLSPGKGIRRVVLTEKRGQVFVIATDSRGRELRRELLGAPAYVQGGVCIADQFPCLQFEYPARPPYLRTRGRFPYIISYSISETLKGPVLENQDAPFAGPPENMFSN